MHFLKSHNLAFNTFFHYMVLDLPSMAWALGAKSLSGDGIAAHFGVPSEVKDPMLHTGETGGAFNVALYQAMLRQISSHQTGLVVQAQAQDHYVSTLVQPLLFALQLMRPPLCPTFTLA
jgi:hypothetical protein